MKNLAPEIVRQKFLIEGFFDIDVDERIIEDYFGEITRSLNLKMYGKPIIFSPGGKGKEENQGYDAFVPLIDSGISLYIWTKSKFLSMVIYSCKNFDEGKATEVTKSFFKIDEIESQSF